jgi:hypothetical protein
MENRMSAINFMQEVADGIQAAADPKDDPGERCLTGGAQAVNKTPANGIPIIREWEYATHRVIAFSKIDSCLGAIQMAGANIVRGAHFSMFASSMVFDTAQFDRAMTAAGFQVNLPILYFGGGAKEWIDGLKSTTFHGVAPFPALLKDAPQKRWIFQMDSGQFTYHSMD